MSAKSVDFRPLPTPEQVRAHGEGGLWEGKTETTSSCTWYKLWDKPREGSWWDSSVRGGHGFCAHGGPWTAMRGKPPAAYFRPLNADGTPRDWAEIDAIVARGTPSIAAAATEPESEYRAPTDAELRAHGGCWRVKDGTFCDVWVNSSGQLVGYYHINLPAERTTGWLIEGHTFFARDRRALCPVDRQGKPMPWPKVAQSAEDWRPLPDTETLKLHRYWRSKPDDDGDVYYIHTTQTGKYDLTVNVVELSTLSQWSEIDSDRDDMDMVIGEPSHRWQPCDVQGNILPWSAITVPAAQSSVQVVTPPPDGKFQVGDVVRVLRFSGKEKFSNSNPGWNPQMAEHLTGTVTVQSIGKCILAAGWAWPVERVSFVSRPSKAEPEQKPAAVTVPATAPEFRKLTREIVEANPGQLWERQGGYRSCYKLTWRDGRFLWDQEPFIRDTDWHVWVGEFDAKWRPLKSDHQPMPWSELKTAVSVPQPISVRLSDSEPLTFTTAGPVSSTGRLVSHADSLSASAVLQIEDAVRRAIAECVSLSPPASLPKDGDPITVASAVAIAREGARQAMQEVGQASRRSIDTLAASDLDIAAEQWYSLIRQPNETDEQLRQRCRDAKAKENPMPSTNHVTSLGTPIPDFTKLSPEDRARYRAALDAADPPTFRDALRSGLEHAPVELALDKLHTFVSRLADLWTEGNEEERATVRRFLRDLLSSDYGKAAIGLGAGAAIPHAAPLAAKLLPDDKDAGPLLRRVGFILVERGTATGAKRLGLDIWDAAGPMLDELRQMLRDLVKGMKQADTVVGFLPPASPKLDFASGVGVVEAETVTQKR